MKYCDACHTSYPNEFSTCPKDQGSLRTTAELVEGMILRDKYQILDKIGAGGMAVVYRARHLAFGEIRAIKVVSGRFGDDPDLLNRFKTEAVITRKLQHPNAVRVDDLDATEDGRPFIVMEYVEGRSLRQVLNRATSFAPARAVNVARQAAAALGAAHRLGIVHRDIKPENMLLVGDDGAPETVKVLDFGIAKVREGVDVGPGYAPTQTGIVVGTPHYLSPEQAMGKRGSEIDGRVDLYALGLVLYEMLVGRLPFESDTSMGMLLHQMQTPPAPPQKLRPDLVLPPQLTALIMKVLSKKAEQRFATAEDMDAALAAVQPLLDPLPQTLASARPGSRMTAGDAPTIPRPRDPAGPLTSGDLPTVGRRPSPRPSAARPAPAAVAEPEPAGGPLKWVVAAALLVAAGAGVFALRRGGPAGGGGDAQIRAGLTRALASDLLKDVVVEPDVADGVVTLNGHGVRQSDADIATSLASGVPGVRKVINRIAVEQAIELRTTGVSSPLATMTASAASGASAAPEPRAADRVAAPAPAAVEPEVASDSVTPLLENAKRAFERGDLDQAEHTLRVVLQRDPGSAAAQATLKSVQVARAMGDAERAMGRSDYPSASAAYRAALQIDPSYEPARMGLKQAEDAQQAARNGGAGPMGGPPPPPRRP